MQERRAALLGLVLVTALLSSLLVGSRPIAPAAVFDALVAPDPASADHTVIRTLRLPRTLLATVAGAALAVAGVLMQGITRNPLAGPGLLGVNAGASFAVVLAIWALQVDSVQQWVWFAFAGAIAASLLVYGLGSVGAAGTSPVRLALAGVALSAVLFALTRAITLLDRGTLDQFRFWAVGSVAGRPATVALEVAPFVAAGFAIAVAVSGQLNVLALGDEGARALGVRLWLARSLGAAAVMLLAGAAVAAVGPIAFVGLVVPHAVRLWFGPEHRWLVPAGALAGAALLLCCDTLGRVAAHPGEVPAGIVTAAVGGAAFVGLVRRARLAEQ